MYAMLRACQPLTDKEIYQLDEYLLSDAVSEQALDYIAMHGYLCALAISPVTVPENQWLGHIIDEDLVSQTNHLDPAMIDLIRKDYIYICACLETDTIVDIPCELTLAKDKQGDCLLEYWCQGFMELIFCQADVWFSQHEDTIAECLLPFMLAANLDDDKELELIRCRPKLCQQLFNQIPALMQDLFLLFRVPIGKHKGYYQRHKDNKRRH